jgi:hypothetical protein
MYLSMRSRMLIWTMVVIAALMILILGFHLFGPAVLAIGKYSQLFGALLGGILAIISVNMPMRPGEEVEPWLGRERLAWTLIGAGAILWGLGECVYRYLLANNLPNFPALSDVGYASLPPLMFIGLLLQPSSDSGRGRLLVMLDSLISMGAILAIAWFLLLGSLAQAPGEANLGKFLLLYYPITDMALLSCVVFLMLRGHGRIYESNARRVSLLLVGLGLVVFAVSDFNYNVQNNMSTYVDGTWADLGWPLGLMIIGIAAYLRRFIPATSGELVEERLRRREERLSFGPAQLTPYFLLAILLTVLILNVVVFAKDSTQIWNRPVLLFATVCVIALVVARQLITQLENERLTRRQAISMERLAAANARVEEQARQIAEHSASLEEGIAHLKEVQAQLANGNLRARARIGGGNLASLAGSFNLMADRLMRFEQVDTYVQKLTRALNDLSSAFESYRAYGRFTLPPSCGEFPEIQRLLLAMGMRPAQPLLRSEQTSTNASQQSSLRWSHSSQPATQRPASAPLSNRLASSPLSQRPTSTPLSSPDRRAGGFPPRTGETSSGPLRGSSPGSERSSNSPETPQLDFPPLPDWGDD